MEAGTSFPGTANLYHVRCHTYYRAASYPQAWSCCKRLATPESRASSLLLFTAVDADGLEEAARNVGICAVVPKTQSWNLLKTIETAVAKSIQ